MVTNETQIVKGIANNHGRNQGSDAANLGWPDPGLPTEVVQFNASPYARGD